MNCAVLPLQRTRLIFPQRGEREIILAFFVRSCSDRMLEYFPACVVQIHHSLSLSRSPLCPLPLASVHFDILIFVDCSCVDDSFHVVRTLLGFDFGFGMDVMGGGCHEDLSRLV